MQPQRVTIWCGISADQLIGLYFFENDDGIAVTVNGERYRQIIQNFVRNIPGMWFQLDEATAYTARETMALLQTVDKNRIVSRLWNINWPAISPDLTAPKFFLWNYLKEKVCL